MDHGPAWGERGAPPCEPPKWRSSGVAGTAAAARRRARGVRGVCRTALGAALALSCAGGVAAGREPQVLSPLLGISREGTTVTFHTSQPATFTVLLDKGNTAYTTIERTTTSLTVQAGHTGGAKYTIRARLLTPACNAAPAQVTVSGHTCQYDAEWYIMHSWQSHLLTLLLLLLVSALVWGAIRILRVRCCPQKLYDADVEDPTDGRGRRVRSPSPVPDFALDRMRAL